MRYCALRLTVLATSLLGVSDFGRAQKVEDLAGLNLTELSAMPVVSAARHAQSRLGSPRAVSVITGEEIRRRGFRNVPEAVGSLAGVFLQQTNYAGGSPIIRGMVGNRILLMLDGIRLNTGAYRFGPNQYLNFIDVNRVERIEVVRGAGSVLYGSDAFGGVINVITRPAPRPDSGAELSGQARVRFSGADHSGAGRLQISGVAGKLGFSAGYTHEQFGDLQPGGGVERQLYTGYRQSAGDVSIALAVGTSGSFTAGISRLKQFNVERTDVLRAGTYRAYEWSPQGSDIAYARYQQDQIGRYVDAITITFAYHRDFEDINQITAADSTVLRSQFDRVHSFNAAVQATTQYGTAHLLTYGVDAALSRVKSAGNQTDLLSQVRKAGPGNYPDGSRFSSGAFFAQDEVALTTRLSAVLGVRHEAFTVAADLYDPLTGGLSPRNDLSATTGSTHALFSLTRMVSLTAGLSQGFRVPNIDDSMILGDTGSRFEIPNPELNPERSVSFEYGARIVGNAGSASASFFHDRYSDFIARDLGLYRGLPFLDINGNGKRDAGELNVYQRQNLSRATVHGFELEGMANLRDGWTWSGSTTWTCGDDTTHHQPLTRIPPLHGVSRITWQPNRSFWVEAAVVAAASQHRLSLSDKADTRIGPGGTAGYAIVHLRAGLRRSILSGMSIAWENITNRRYRLHGSGFDRPGSNLVLSFSRFF